MADSKPINWAYPFKAKAAAEGESAPGNATPELYYEALANAKDGFYPMGANGLWHGGVHFDEGTAGSLDQSAIHCIADGEVIAYRIDKHYPISQYDEGSIALRLPFSTGFALVRHRLVLPEPPAPATSGEDAAIAATPEPTALTVYSLYMHLLDWTGYQAASAPTPPDFLGETLYSVKADKATDNLVGLRVRTVAKNGAVKALLTKGSKVKVGDPDPSSAKWRKLLAIVEGSAIPALSGEDLGWVYTGEMTPVSGEPDTYLVADGAKDTEPTLVPNKGLNVRKAGNSSSLVTGLLPLGAKIRIKAGSGAYRELLEVVEGKDIAPLSANSVQHIKGFVHFDSLQPSRLAPTLDKVQLLAQPQPIKAGSVVGHLGKYQNHNDGRPRSMAHVEVFTCEDVPAFIAKSQAVAARLPAEQKTLIKVHAGSSIILPSAADYQVPAERDVRISSDSPKEGCWVKVQQYVELKAKKAGLGHFDNAHNRYPIDSAKKAELAAEFGLTASELPDTVDFLLESYKDDGSDMFPGRANIPSTHLRRKIGVLLKTPCWVARSQLSDTGRRASTSAVLEAWKHFPLQVSSDGKGCGYDRILSGASWGNLAPQHKAIAPDNTRWWYLTVGDKDGKDISGWVPEIDPIISKHSPWEWQGFSTIQDKLPLDAHLARTLDATGRATDEESQSYAALIEEAERGEILSKLYDVIDLPDAKGKRDQKLTPTELKTALGKPWLAQQLSLLISQHESEWFWNEGKWNQLDKLMEHTPANPNPNWVAEKKRIETLSWWKELAGQPGIAADGMAWHFHAPALLENFSSAGCKCKNKLTKEQLRAIAPHASSTKIDLYIDPINEMFERFKIDHCISRAHVLAQMLHESGSMNFVTEGLNSNAPLPAYHPYIGRGLLQITWEINYRRYGDYIGENFIGHPHYLKMSQPPHCVVSVGWFWSELKNLNTLSDKDDFIYLTYLINGGFNGYDHRLSFINSAVEELEIKSCTKLNINGGYKFEDSEAYNKAKPSFAWGLWSDPGSSASGKTKAKDQAIAGYLRYIEIYNTTQSVRDDTTTKYYSSTRRALQAKEHAEQRIEVLRNS